MTGISSGFRDLDFCTEGLQRRNLIVVAAHPGMGKTAFCLNMGCHIAINEKKPVAVFSLDLSGQELARMILSSQSRVGSMRLRTGYLEDSDWTRLEKALKTLDDTPIFIDDTPGLTVMELRSRAHQLKKEKYIELIIIDSIQCIRRVTGEENRSREMSEVARSLKEMARELNIPVVLTSQLSGNVEMRRDKSPMLSDLREDGNIAQDADVVTFLHREDYHNEASESSNKAEIIITRNRDRCQEAVELLFLKDFLAFVPVEADGDGDGDGGEAGINQELSV
ncbi:MAG: DnaB-like helicase C-terminal domain-containing protein [Candidatus Xenobiia bacterium LiM19]